MLAVCEPPPARGSDLQLAVTLIPTASEGIRVLEHDRPKDEPSEVAEPIDGAVSETPETADELIARFEARRAPAARPVVRRCLAYDAESR